jgi:hypothetical protein
MEDVEASFGLDLELLNNRRCEAVSPEVFPRFKR